MSQPHTAAPHELMRQLWLGLLEVLLDYVTNTPKGMFRASMLMVVRSFLHDNGVSARTLEQGGYNASLQKLKEKVALPFPEAKQ